MVEEQAVSVLIATYRSPESLERVLNAVLHQLAAGDQVIVVDDGSGDDTPERLASIDDPRLTVVVQHNQGVSAARNRAATDARSPILLFLDDDEVPVPGWLSAHREAHDAPHRVAMGRAELVVPSGLGSRVVAAAPHGDTAVPTLLVNNSFSVHRIDFDRVGGFDPRFVHGGEDVDLGLRLAAAGCELAVAPDAIIRHEIDRSYRDFRQQRLRRGRASLLLEERHNVALVALASDVPHRDRPWMVIASRSRLATEVVCALLWGLLRLAGLASAWPLQAAAAGRITLMLGLVGRQEAQRAATTPPGVELP